MSTEVPVKKEADRKANGRGSIYKVKKSNSKEVIKAAIHDINGKRRTKNFARKADAEPGYLTLVTRQVSATNGMLIPITLLFGAGILSRIGRKR